MKKAKSAKKPSQSPKTVIVQYPMNLYLADNKYDRLLNLAGRKFKGEETGSGAGLGSRDVSFEFPSEKEAIQFQSYLEKDKSGDYGFVTFVELE